MSYNNAFIYCQQNNGNLAKITTANKDAIKQLLAPYSKVNNTWVF